MRRRSKFRIEVLHWCNTERMRAPIFVKYTKKAPKMGIYHLSMVYVHNLGYYFCQQRAMMWSMRVFLS